MGYTHYWRRVPESFDAEAFAAVADDLRRLVPALEKAGVRLAGGLGTGDPEIEADVIRFNGPSDCGHTRRDLGITWPSDEAAGVASDLEIEVADGVWFAGAKLSTRACGGDCSHETFLLTRDVPEDDWHVSDDDGRIFDFCKTAYKPYDLAVTAALVVAKRHLGDALLVTSDGSDRDWVEAVLLTEAVLGYGADFRLDRGEA